MKVEFGSFIPERFRRPLELGTYPDFLIGISGFRPVKITAVPQVEFLKRTEQEKTMNILKVQMSVGFTARGKEGRLIKYEHVCQVMKTSDPHAPAERSLMVPHWDTRASVWAIQEDARSRTFLSGLFMVRDLSRKFKDTKVVLKDKFHEFGESDIKELEEHAELRRLAPWPNTPGFDR